MKDYRVIVRTAKEGYLAFEFNVDLNELDTHKLYNEVKNDKRYRVALIPSNKKKV
jgi:hypothetical protein